MLAVVVCTQQLNQIIIPNLNKKTTKSETPHEIQWRHYFSMLLSLTQKRTNKKRQKKTTNKIFKK